MGITKIDDYLSFSDAADFVGVSRVTIYDWLDSGKISAVEISGIKFIRRDQLELIRSEYKAKLNKGKEII